MNERLPKNTSLLLVLAKVFVSKLEQLFATPECAAMSVVELQACMQACDTCYHSREICYKDIILLIMAILYAL
jgi:hypothetical protein